MSLLFCEICAFFDHNVIIFTLSVQSCIFSQSCVTIYLLLLMFVCFFYSNLIEFYFFWNLSGVPPFFLKLVVYCVYHCTIVLFPMYVQYVCKGVYPTPMFSYPCPLTEVAPIILRVPYILPQPFLYLIVVLCSMCLHHCRSVKVSLPYNLFAKA